MTEEMNEILNVEKRSRCRENITVFFSEFFEVRLAVSLLKNPSLSEENGLPEKRGEGKEVDCWIRGVRPGIRVLGSVQ